MSEVHTTISACVGGLPFKGVDGLIVDSETRAAVRTWLSRMGWSTPDYISLDTDTLRAVYASHASYVIRCPAGIVTRTEEEGQWYATSDYAPRNARLLAALARRNGGTAGTATADTASTATAIPPAPVAPVALVDGSKEAELARILRDVIGGGRLDEARVVALIQEHAPKSDGVVYHRVEVVREGVVIKAEGLSHPMLPTLMRVMQARQTNGFVPGIRLVGSTAGGKTHGVEQACKSLGLAYYCQGSMSMAHELLGFVDAGGTYHRTPFRDAYEHGGVCMLDELDSYDANALQALNAALANGLAAFPDGMVKRNPDSIFVAGMNTWGTGATAEYVGRARLDAATLSRFPVVIEWQPDAALELAISGNPSFTARVQAARVRARAAGLKHLIDARHSMAGAGLIAVGFSEDEAANMTYLSGLSVEQRNMVEGK